MSLYIVNIHGDIEGDYEIIRKYEEQEPILDKLRAEIEKLRPILRPEQMTDYDYAMVDVVNDIVAIIDKYKAESEVEDGIRVLDNGSRQKVHNCTDCEFFSDSRYYRAVSWGSCTKCQRIFTSITPSIEVPSWCPLKGETDEPICS